MDIIEMKIVGESIAITFRPGKEAWTQTRYINAQEAFALSLLLTCDAPDVALNFETKSGVALQIENYPHSRAWVSLRSPLGENEPDITACLEDEAGGRLGSRLNTLHRAVLWGRSAEFERTTCSQPVTYFYRDDEEPSEAD